MYKQTSEKEKDTSHTQNSADETHKPKSTLVDRIPIQGTPFWQIQTEQGFFAVMAENIITPVFKTEEELEKYFIENNWNIVSLIILLLIDKKLKDFANTSQKAVKLMEQVDMDIKSGL